MFAWLFTKQRDSSVPPPFLELRSAKWFILATICIAVFTDVFLYCIIVPVIPFALSIRAGIPEEDVQHWVSVLLAVYGGALLAASPICGWLADKSPNRRLPLLVGLLALAGATVMLCIGSSIGVLVTGRLLQGFSAAVVWTVGLALLVDTVGQKEIGQIMGYVFLSISVAYLTAPLLGGVVYARAGYYAVFYMAFAVIAVDITLRLLLVEKKVAKRWLDEPATSPPPPSLSLTNPLSSPASGPVSEPGAENSPDINNSAITSAEKSVVPPTVPARLHRFTLPPIVTLLGSRRLLSALWCCMVQATLTTAFDSVLPLFVQSTFSWSSTGAGLIFLPLIVPSLVAPYIGFIADKYGPRYLAFAGFLFICPFLILLRLVTFDSLPQKAGLCVLLALVGFGLAVAMVPLLAEVTYVVEAKERATPGIFGERGAYAQAYALFNVFFAAGTLIGPIWGGFVVRSSGWRVMTLTLGVLAAVTAVPALVWTGGVVTRRHRGERRVGVHEGEGSGVQGEGTEKGPSDA